MRLQQWRTQTYVQVEANVKLKSGWYKTKRAMSYLPDSSLILLPFILYILYNICMNKYNIRNFIKCYSILHNANTILELLKTSLQSNMFLIEYQKSYPFVLPHFFLFSFIICYCCFYYIYIQHIFTHKYIYKIIRLSYARKEIFLLFIYLLFLPTNNIIPEF